NDGAGTVDGQALGTWFDQAFSNDATVNLAGQEPTWRDNINYNMNFNPVVDFDNDVNAGADGDFSYDDLSTEFLQGTGGLYTQDLFVVVVPDMTINSTFGYMDLIGGDENPGSNETDATGIGFGQYSARFSNEVITYCVGTTSGGNGYGVTHNTGGSSFNEPMIINARNNAGATQQELYMNANDIETLQNDIPDFSNVNNSRYWIGRTEGYEASADARIVEIVSYSSRKDNTTERNRIQSYLALKYGITLGVNGTAMNYFDSNNNIIWNSGLNFGYNYDIAGIARDDASDFIQKQSKSVNPTAAVSIGLGDVALTNNANTYSFNADRDYLIWGHDGNTMNVAPATSDIIVNLGPTTTTTITQRTLRTWKIVESGGDVPTVEISILQSDLVGLPPLVGNDAYVMVVADDAGFTSNLETVFLNAGMFNGQPAQEITYDFDGTRYFTIGVAHETVEPRHSSFDGTNDFTLIGSGISLTGDFSVSAWVRTTGSNVTNSNKTILGKKGTSGGYQFAVRNDNTIEFSVGPTAADRIRSTTNINTGIWHHVAVTYNGASANLYIDGMLETTSAMNTPVASSEKFTLGAIYESKNVIYDFFEGDIDEVRVWDAALGINEIRFIMNQEIRKSGTGFVEGRVIPSTISKNEVSTRAFSDLLAYYDMDSYLGTHLNDVSDNNNRGSLIVPNNFNIEGQTAPLPYISSTNGSFDASGTWVNGILYYMPGTASVVDNTRTIDWNIVQTLHDITMDNASLPVGNANNRTLLGLLTDANELSITSDNGLTITHYLNLDGVIDLDGESQLIQTQDSELDLTSGGSLERDQQGTSDTYTYNYWSSPVSTINTTNNNQAYTVPNMMRDGTTPATPGTLNFLTTGYDGVASPIGVADYWIWKFANRPDDDYSQWQHVRSAGTIDVGEGFTMKGPGTGTILTPQNYVFTGKPNNADISLTISAGNDYLVGNPYPSAIDAHEFLNDNPLTGGTLYFWEHWGGGSHLLREYQGGYAQYNYSGGTGAASYGTNDPDVGTGGTPVKLPGQYIPVSQGFFVFANANGNVNFENDQRAFVTEGASSVFVRNGNTETNRTGEEDTRMKFRIGFNSVNEIHRQLLLTVDENASDAVDWGYDGIIKEQQIDDMYWMIDNDKYIIQGTNQVDVSTVVPLGIHTRDDGMNEITIDRLENVSDDVDIFVHDRELNIYHDLRQGNYQIYLVGGEYLDRFDIVFRNENQSLDIDDIESDESFEVYYSNEEKHIVILNPLSTQISNLEIFNVLGQSIKTYDEIPNESITQLKVTNLSIGTYIIKITTEQGTLSKKVLVK
ncbi:MAG: T9SS type A sorting domain-containing protein, partial [Flavobacteriaceae bacterium]|nr:T9SS type A sorting domain-containing protein [Flavobacteriaceae bacterium]